MDKNLRFWVEIDYEKKKFDHPNRTKLQLLAEILREYENRGDAMRYLNAKGKIAWTLSPSMLMALADAEREVEADMADLP